ncbi:MAG: MBL fold metallo-hydrolase [Acidobacteriota bacterium]
MSRKDASFFAPTEFALLQMGAEPEVLRLAEVTVRRLDSIFADAIRGMGDPRVFLRMDTQGYDLDVIAGAGGCLGQIRGLQSELSVLPLYGGMPNNVEALAEYRRLGFEPTGIYPIFRSDETLMLAKLDRVMVRWSDGSWASGRWGRRVRAGRCDRAARRGRFHLEGKADCDPPALRAASCQVRRATTGESRERSSEGNGGSGGTLDERVFIKQLLAGRDFAAGDPIAAQMVNFVYLVGDRAKRECLVVDPAWDIDGILAAAEREGMRIVGVLATHYHPDHIGGDLFGHPVQGLVELKERLDLPVHVHRAEIEGVRVMTGLAANDLAAHEGGDTVTVGEVPVMLVHTPGHTPGSQCFLVAGDALVSGDTLFVQGCGRVDLPGGDTDQMYLTLTQRLSKLPDDILLMPGHDYGDAPTSTMGEQRRTNACLRIGNLEDWRRFMGA